jgi:glycosyltransferase involved in cell wall biosynthesis
VVDDSSGSSGGSSRASGVRFPAGASPPLVVATIFREEGNTGVHTHIRQVRQCFEDGGTATTLVTPFSWNRPLTYPVFAPRLVLRRCSGAAGVLWYRHWHEVFLRNALHKNLAQIGDCIVYAQGPLEARAALRARRGPYQRVVMAVHFRGSQADEHAEPGREIKRGGTVFRAIRQVEQEVILQLDGLVYVSRWAQDALLSWLPEAARVPSVVIGNFVEPLHLEPRQTPFGDLVTTGRIDLQKNHRYLLEILNEANRAGRSFTLDLFGEGPLRADLEQQASSLGLAGQVRFRGFRPDVRDLLPNYRAYVHASYKEVSPFAIIEAMAAGLPIMAAKIGGIPELFDDGVEGRFWSLDDPADAAATLIELLDNGPARAAAGKAAYDRFHREFDATVVAPRLRSFLLGDTSPDPAGSNRTALSNG